MGVFRYPGRAPGPLPNSLGLASTLCCAASQAPLHNTVGRCTLSPTALCAGRPLSPPARRGVCLKEGTCASECSPDKAGFNHSVGVQEFGLDKRKMTTTPDTVALGEAVCGAGPRMGTRKTQGSSVRRKKNVLALVPAREVKVG